MAEKPDKAFWAIVGYALLVAMWLLAGKPECATLGTFTAIGHGDVYSQDATYLTARNAETGDGTTTNTIYVGQSPGTGTFSVYRGFLAIPIGISNMQATACTLFVNGDTDLSNTDFNLNVVNAQSYKTTMATADFNAFDGHAASGAYSIAALNDTWSSSSYSADWNAIVFNAAGLDRINKSDTLWIALLSSRDVSATEPSANEYIRFDSPSDAGTEPYLSIEYNVLSNERRIMNESYLWKNGDNTMLWRP